ncbi:MAG TPA: hypothetical protein VNK49_05970 [Anaerolineales bacterium]|nr:hypothetical protein [Anaerolineales bacterium]
MNRPHAHKAREVKSLKFFLTAYARLPITINLPPPGKHHILVLRIDTPGVPMCILWGDPHSRILPNSVYGKLVGVNVLPET